MGFNVAVGEGFLGKSPVGEIDLTRENEEDPLGDAWDDIDDDDDFDPKVVRTSSPSS